MPSWSDFETAAPALAAYVRERLDAHRHKTIATLRRDGSPRISGTEAFIRRRRAVDRLHVGGAQGARPPARPALRAPQRLGRARRLGRGREAGGRGGGDDGSRARSRPSSAGNAPPGPMHLFRLDVAEVSTVRLSEDRKAARHRRVDARRRRPHHVAGRRMAVRVLVVDDEPAVRTALERALALERYDVRLAADGRAALDHLVEHQVDAIVLDVAMPGVDGVEVCRRLRSAGDRTPVLMLTARDAIDDRVAGLDAGADDYLVKPFALKELQARLRALLRRAEPRRAPASLRFADLELDPVAREVRRGARRIELSRTEFALLELFLAHPRQVLSRSEIFERVWGYDFGVDVQRARRLRRLPAPQDRGGAGSRACSTPCAASATSCARGRPDPAAAAGADHGGDRRRDGGGGRRAVLPGRPRRPARPGRRRADGAGAAAGGPGGARLLGPRRALRRRPRRAPLRPGRAARAVRPPGRLGRRTSARGRRATATCWAWPATR